MQALTGILFLRGSRCSNASTAKPRTGVGEGWKYEQLCTPNDLYTLIAGNQANPTRDEQDGCVHVSVKLF